MADTKISALTAATAAADANEFAINEAGTSKKLTSLKIKTYVTTNAVVINPKHPAYGAVGNGTTDDTAAFALVIAAIKASSHTIPQGVRDSDPAGGILVDIPPGDYLITANGGLLNSTSMAGHLFGVKFRGAGKGITNIIFKPTVAGNLIDIDYYISVQFEGIGFFSDTAGSTLMYVNAANAAQRFEFKSCSFDNWKYVNRLQGTNNNSEWLFHSCNSARIEDAGAWTFIGASSTSDQFLNFWYTNCTHWTTSAPMIDSAKGGHFHLDQCDFSDWGASLAAAGRLFYLRGAGHSDGSSFFSCRDCRTEFKNVFCGIIYSEWGYDCNVLFDGFDMSSQIGTYTYGAAVVSLYFNAYGGTYTFRNCTLAGGVTVSRGDGDYGYFHTIMFDQCTWAQKESPSDVVTYETSRVTNSTISNPPVEFYRCRPYHGSYTDGTSGTGAAVWDAMIGWNNAMVQSLPKRCVRIGGGYGMSLVNGIIPKVLLPVGALITDVYAASPVGTSVEADGGTWTLATTDGSPVTIATITVSGAMSAGFNLAGNLTLPFPCTTTAKARLTLTPTSVASPNLSAVLVIMGYW